MGESPTSCEICHVNFDSREDFQEHTWSFLHHIKIEKKNKGLKHRCTLCKNVSSTLKDYNSHLEEARHGKALLQLRKAQGREPAKVDPKKIRNTSAVSHEGLPQSVNNREEPVAEKRQPWHNGWSDFPKYPTRLNEPPPSLFNLRFDHYSRGGPRDDELRLGRTPPTQQIYWNDGAMHQNSRNPGREWMKRNSADRGRGWGNAASKHSLSWWNQNTGHGAPGCGGGGSGNTYWQRWSNPQDYHHQQNDAAYERRRGDEGWQQPHYDSRGTTAPRDPFYQDRSYAPLFTDFGPRSQAAATRNIERESIRKPPLLATPVRSEPAGVNSHSRDNGSQFLADSRQERLGISNERAEKVCASGACETSGGGRRPVGAADSRQERLAVSNERTEKVRASGGRQNAGSAGEEHSSVVSSTNDLFFIDTKGDPTMRSARPEEKQREEKLTKSSRAQPKQQSKKTRASPTLKQEKCKRTNAEVKGGARTAVRPTKVPRSASRQKGSSSEGSGVTDVALQRRGKELRKGSNGKSGEAAVACKPGKIAECATTAGEVGKPTNEVTQPEKRMQEIGKDTRRTEGFVATTVVKREMEEQHGRRDTEESSGREEEDECRKKEVAERRAVVRAVKKPVTKAELMKMVTMPRSRMQRMQLTHFVKCYTASKKMSLPRFNINMGTSEMVLDSAGQRCSAKKEAMVSEEMLELPAEFADLADLELPDSIWSEIQDILQQESSGFTEESSSDSNMPAHNSEQVALARARAPAAAVAAVGVSVKMEDPGEDNDYSMLDEYLMMEAESGGHGDSGGGTPLHALPITGKMADAPSATNQHGTISEGNKRASKGPPPAVCSSTSIDAEGKTGLPVVAVMEGPPGDAGLDGSDKMEAALSIEALLSAELTEFSGGVDVWDASTKPASQPPADRKANLKVDPDSAESRMVPPRNSSAPCPGSRDFNTVIACIKRELKEDACESEAGVSLMEEEDITTTSGRRERAPDAREASGAIRVRSSVNATLPAGAVDQTSSAGDQSTPNSETAGTTSPFVDNTCDSHSRGASVYHTSAYTSQHAAGSTTHGTPNSTAVGSQGGADTSRDARTRDLPTPPTPRTVDSPVSATGGASVARRAGSVDGRALLSDEQANARSILASPPLSEGQASHGDRLLMISVEEEEAKEERRAAEMHHTYLNAVLKQTEEAIRENKAKMDSLIQRESELHQERKQIVQGARAGRRTRVVTPSNVSSSPATTSKPEEMKQENPLTASSSPSPSPAAPPSTDAAAGDPAAAEQVNIAYLGPLSASLLLQLQAELAMTGNSSEMAFAEYANLGVVSQLSAAVQEAPPGMNAIMAVPPGGNFVEEAREAQAGTSGKARSGKRRKRTRTGSEEEEEEPVRGKREKKSKKLAQASLKQGKKMKGKKKKLVKPSKKQCKQKSLIPAEKQVSNMPADTSAHSAEPIKSDSRATDEGCGVDLECLRSYLCGGVPIKYCGHTGAVMDLQIYEDAELMKAFLITCSGDRTALRFDLVSGQCLNIYGEHSKAVTSIYLACAQKTTKMRLYTGCLDETLRCFDVESGKLMKQLRVGERIHAMCGNSFLGNIYLGLANGHVLHVKMKTGKVVDDWPCSTRVICCLATAREGSRHLVVIASFDKSITLRDATTGLFLRMLNGHKNIPISLVVASQKVLSTAGDGRVLVHDLYTGELLKVYRGADNDVLMSLCVYSDLLITGNRRGGVEAMLLQNSQPYVCQIEGCGLPFAYPEHLILHMASHGEQSSGSSARIVESQQQPSSTVATEQGGAVSVEPTSTS
ncbi:PREDICTED: uncharacterized protein LOC106820385 isoform X2 [Priapulus caudatus]|uniref:Uncharacterized protein LOC106820385 isoform X2 n=1 Tax=Priapulus caudatus TaxID=37621 RepID=A0ABM1F7H9_PRICU|nr:PREDICTED: uncharacterized protein LOC106820385 isoform X2 [Priapulus caudatus]